MLTFFHAPQTRSTVIAGLIEMLGAEDRIETRIVTIPRMDGSGGRDTANPHPEGKVPLLVHDGRLITERGAIIMHLCALFPEAGLAPAPGTPDWGVFATWMTWYQGVLEPTFICEAAGITHDWLTAAIRDHATAVARIRAALDKGPWLMGDNYSAADLLVHAPYVWFEAMAPKDPVVRDWIDRCKAKGAHLKVMERDAALMAA